MTKSVVVAVFDSAVQAYGRPIFVPAIGVALRSFQDEVNRKDSENPVAAHPSDYELFNLGVFDDATGVFIGCEGGPVSLARAKDLVIRGEAQ